MDEEAEAEKEKEDISIMHRKPSRKISTRKIVQKEENAQYLLRTKNLTEDEGIGILVDSADRLSRAIATGNADNIRRASMIFIQKSAILPLRMISKFVQGLDTRIKVLPVDRRPPNNDKIG